MPHSDRWIQQLISDLPDDPQKLLIPGRPGRRRNYADPGFLKVYYEWLGKLIFEDPQAGLAWARVAPHLALMTPVGREPEERQVHRECVVMAYALLGGAYRAVGRPDDADEPYRVALKMADSEPISPAVRVDLLRRLAYLRIFQGRSGEALGLLELNEIEGLERLKTLLCRGHALARLHRFPEAICHFGEVLEEINPNESASAERTHRMAAQNMAYALQEGDMGSDACWLALAQVGKAKKLTPHRPSLQLYQLQWIEGLTWCKLWAYGTPTGFSLAHEAEQALKRALHGFLHLRVPWEIALAGLDLAQLYRDLGRWDELLELSLETLQRFQILSGDTQTVAALGLIVDAVRAQQRVAAAIVSARAVLRTQQQSARRQPPTRVSLRAPAAPPPAGRSNLALVKTRTRLLAAAHEEIENGFKMRAILKRAGVNRTTFYHHFGDREGCAAAVVDEHMHGMVTDWLRRVDAGDPLETLAGLVEAAPPLVALPNGLAADRLEKLSQMWRRSLAEKLTGGQRAGTVRADVDPDETAAYLIAGLRTRDPLCLRGVLRYLEILRPPLSEGQKEQSGVSQLLKTGS